VYGSPHGKSKQGMCTLNCQYLLTGDYGNFTIEETAGVGVRKVTSYLGETLGHCEKTAREGNTEETKELLERNERSKISVSVARKKGSRERSQGRSVMSGFKLL
jgi:hypothetical protein